MHLRGICWFAGLIAALLCHTGAAHAETPQDAAQLWVNMVTLADHDLLAAASDAPFERQVLVDGKPGKKCKKKAKAAKRGRALTGVLACAIAEDSAFFTTLTVRPGDYAVITMEGLPASLASFESKLAKAAKKKGSSLVLVRRQHLGKAVDIVFVVQARKKGGLRVTGVYESKGAIDASNGNVIGVWREQWGDPSNTDVTYNDLYRLTLDGNGNLSVSVQDKEYPFDKLSFQGGVLEFSQHTSFEVRYYLTMSADGLQMSGTATTPDGVYPIRWDRVE